MGIVCRVVFQPVIKLIQVLVSFVEFVLKQVCQFVTEFVNVLTNILTYVCNTVIHTVCGSVCSVICGICDFFCGIFGCDCGCENVCNNVCQAITNVVCGFTYILKWILHAIVVLICNYILQAILVLLNLIEAIVVMILTWICSIIDIIIQWFLCWTYIAEIFNNTRTRYFKIAPKIIPNGQGYSDWFVYVSNPPNVDGSVTPIKYILGDRGLPLLPNVDSNGNVTFDVVSTDGNYISGQLTGQKGNPLLYYPYKIIEVADHMFGDRFASTGKETGKNSTPGVPQYIDNLLTYSDITQSLLETDSITKKDNTLVNNVYSNWPNKYTGGASNSNYFGDNTRPDMGTRVDVSNCDHPTNTFLNPINEIQFTPCNTALSENMGCGAGQTLTFDQTNFLLNNKDSNDTAITTYFVSKYSSDDTSVGCNDLLGYTIVTFQGSNGPLFITNKILNYSDNTNEMMKRIVENISANTSLVRAAETYLHECGHQCGLFHDSDAPDCENDTTLHVSKTMNPGGTIRRILTRLQWCMIWNSDYMTTNRSNGGLYFNNTDRAPELPDSRVPPPEPPIIK
jgi:hypothetical protein